MSIPYWPTSLPQSPATGLEYSPADVRATFEADIGEPISRPRTTGAPFILEPQWTLTDGQIATFEAFYATDLGQGSQRFAMRDVVTGDLRMWRFLEVYRRQFLVKRVARVQAKLMMLPGVPWFAPYGLAGFSTVPSFVADYENGVYGIDGLRKTAADMPDIEGTYLVKYTIGNTTVEQTETLTAGDIAATAPSNTLITRRNLLTETDGLDGGGWSELTNVAAGAGTRYVTPNVATAPDGTTTADKLIESTDSDLQRIFKSVTVTDGAQYTFSTHLKADDRTQVQLRTTARVGPVFNLSAGTMDATGSAMDDQGITSLGDGWYRCWFKTTASGAADVPQIVLRSGGTGTYTGDGASGVLAWGVQYEPGDLTAYQSVADGTEFTNYERIVGYPV